MADQAGYRGLAACCLALLLVGKVAATTENAALQLAVEDLATLPRDEQLYTRYVWVTDGKFEGVQSVSLALNSISQATVIYRPLYRMRDITVKRGKDALVKRVVVVRVSLRAYAPRRADLDELVQQWENFRFDPKFNLLLTKDTLRFAGAVHLPKRRVKITKTRRVLRQVPVYLGEDGKYYNGKWVTQKYEVERRVSPFDAGEQVVRVVSEHLDKHLVSVLVEATRSQAPVVNHRYFISRALTAIKNAELFTVVYGGLYYELSGIRRGFEKGTDEDNFLEGLGVGSVGQGINAKRIFDRLRSDQRVAMFKSGVTGKPRRVDVFKSLVGRDSQSIVSFTHDLKDQDIDIGTHPVMNLIDFKDRAREVIYEKQNGLQGYVLFNGAGVLQDEVPPDVAADVTIPAPNGTRLQPAVSCMRCHLTEDGWRAAPNDVRRLVGIRKLGRAPLLDIFDDRNGVSRVDVLDRLAGLYAGDLELKVFPRARNDYASAILRATGPWRTSLDQTDVVKVALGELTKEFGQYSYGMVSARVALDELDIPGERSPEALERILPPLPILVDGAVPEDPRIGALLTGLEIKRSDWDLVYSFVATRLVATRLVVSRLVVEK